MPIFSGDYDHTYTYETLDDDNDVVTKEESVSGSVDVHVSVSEFYEEMDSSEETEMLECLATSVPDEFIDVLNREVGPSRVLEELADSIESEDMLESSETIQQAARIVKLIAAQFPNAALDAVILGIAESGASSPDSLSEDAVEHIESVMDFDEDDFISGIHSAVRALQTRSVNTTRPTSTHQLLDSTIDDLCKIDVDALPPSTIERLTDWLTATVEETPSPALVDIVKERQAEIEEQLKNAGLDLGPTAERVAEEIRLHIVGGQAVTVALRGTRGRSALKRVYQEFYGGEDFTFLVKDADAESPALDGDKTLEEIAKLAPNGVIAVRAA